MPLDVHLVTPEREVWSGDAEMVVARGVEGEVGILAGHAPLLVQLAIGPLRLQIEGGTWETAVVDGGFLHVSTEEGTTRVDVLATSGEMANEIDLAAAEHRRREAEARLQTYDTEVMEAEIEAAKADLAKAVARITLVGR
jgi:F-type H+-transporting ATPase subunit epsilon